jgi:hypothetical protein
MTVPEFRAFKVEDSAMKKKQLPQLLQVLSVPQRMGRCVVGDV